ncbi:hypothetical protein Q8W34_21450, partial [Pseudoalteromonas marina]|nr:hypothetical protein [Pseudoalteromonas marina]
MLDLDLIFALQGKKRQKAAFQQSEEKENNEENKSTQSCHSFKKEIYDALAEVNLGSIYKNLGDCL